MKKRDVYLIGIPLQDAGDRFFHRLASQGLVQAMDGELISVDVGALSRVTSEPVFAKLSSPAYHSCAMDGIATRSHVTFGASETNPISLQLGEDAVFVDTGDPLPEGFDSVIMVEDLVEVTSDTVTIIAPSTPWQHVRTVGEDIVATEIILPENHEIRAVDLGALLAAGVTQAMVRRKPKVVIIPTGDELISPGVTPEIGTLLSLTQGLSEDWSESGRGTCILGYCPDNPQAITEAVNRASPLPTLLW